MSDINTDSKSILKMAYPLLISMLIQQLVGITDVIFMGRLGETALASSALGSTYFFTIFMVVFGFGMGAQILIGCRNGECLYAHIGKIFYQSCSFLLLMSLTFIALSKETSPWLLGKIISNPSVSAQTLQYLDWRIWGLLCSGLIIMCRSFFVGITATGILTHVSVVMVLSNIMFNYILIFGKFGCPSMGISGAALGSNLAEFLALSVYIFYFIFKIDLKKYGLNSFVFKDLPLLGSILSLSVWTMIQQFISMSTWFLFFVAIEHLSERALAVSNLIRSLSSFPFVIINALSAVAGTLTANLIGAGQTEKVFPVCRNIIRLSALIVLPLLMLMGLFEEPILRIYTDDPTLIADSKMTEIVMLLSFLPFIPAWILFQAVSGTGHTRSALKIEFTAMGFYMFYVLTAIFELKVSLPLCWLADWVYNIAILILSWHFMISDQWKDGSIRHTGRN